MSVSQFTGKSKTSSMLFKNLLSINENLDCTAGVFLAIVTTSTFVLFLSFITPNVKGKGFRFDTAFIILTHNYFFCLCFLPSYLISFLIFSSFPSFLPALFLLFTTHFMLVSFPSLVFPLNFTQAPSHLVLWLHFHPNIAFSPHHLIFFFFFFFPGFAYISILLGRFPISV